MFGSYQATGLDGNVCSNRFSRLGAYGYGSDTTHPTSGVNWNETNWGSLQSQCFERNVGRYSPSETNSRPIRLTLPVHPRVAARTLPRDQPTSSPHSSRYKPRSAVILRAWHDMEWTENLKQNVRSLITELSLHSGGEYQVFVLVHVKDESIPIYTDDDEVMKEIKARFIPHEFRDMVVLFNENTLKSWYPRVEEHRYNAFSIPQLLNVARSPSNPAAQIFSIGNRFKYFLRCSRTLSITGNWKWIPDSPATLTIFSKSPRSLQNDNRGNIFGQITPIGPKPPVAFPEDDKYEWGVGEEADLITFLPIFDPTDTQWLFRNLLWGLPEDVPRRTSPVAMGRVSRELLHQMHIIQIQRGMGFVSEMTPPSLALWHGLKAVHVPQPLNLDGKWTSKEINRIMNLGEPDKINGGPDSLWNWDHLWDHILYRLTYMFTTQTAEDLYRRWLGYPIDPNQYTDGTYVSLESLIRSYFRADRLSYI